MKSHKELIAWQLSQQLALAIQLATEKSNTGARQHLYQQLRRSSSSVPLNIAEGYGKGPGKSCRNHLKIALGSAVETSDLLEFLEKLGEPWTDMVQDAARIRRVLYVLWKRSRG